jgi:hypothetical protein
VGANKHVNDNRRWWPWAHQRDALRLFVKALRFTTVARFGGNQGDLTRAATDVVTTWVADEKEKTSIEMNER